MDHAHTTVLLLRLAAPVLGQAIEREVLYDLPASPSMWGYLDVRWRDLRYPSTPGLAANALFDVSDQDLVIGKSSIRKNTTNINLVITNDNK